VEVFVKNRTLEAQNSVFGDNFQTREAHIYRIAATPGH
jgi:hypothetical protein